MHEQEEYNSPGLTTTVSDRSLKAFSKLYYSNTGSLSFVQVYGVLLKYIRQLIKYGLSMIHPIFRVYVFIP